MRRIPSPPTVPIDADVYLVLDDFEDLGTAYIEADPNKANEKTVIADMLSGQYNSPQWVLSFNTAEGWARDVSEDIARAVANAALARGEALTAGTEQFVDMHLGDDRPRRRHEPETFIEPNAELRTALAMIRMAIMQYAPITEEGRTPGETAETLVKAIRRLAAERDHSAQINLAKEVNEFVGRKSARRAWEP